METNIHPYLGLYPRIDKTVYISDGVKIIGDVTILNNSSIWYNTVIRGDVHFIKIGEYTNIQDLCMLHVTNNKFPLIIGNHVTVGHSAKLHGCIIKDYTLVGIGSIILDGAIIEEYSMIAAGAVVKPGFIVPSGTLVAGVPAKIVRNLTETEIEDIKNSGIKYYKYSLNYKNKDEFRD